MLGFSLWRRRIHTSAVLAGRPLGEVAVRRRVVVGTDSGVWNCDVRPPARRGAGQIQRAGEGVFERRAESCLLGRDDHRPPEPDGAARRRPSCTVRRGRRSGPVSRLRLGRRRHQIGQHHLWRMSEQQYVNANVSFNLKKN